MIVAPRIYYCISVMMYHVQFGNENKAKELLPCFIENIVGLKYHIRKAIAKEKNQNFVANDDDYKIVFLESSDKLEKNEEMPEVVYYLTEG